MQFKKKYIKKLFLSKDPCIARCTECTIVQNGQVQYRGVSIKDNINIFFYHIKMLYIITILKLFFFVSVIFSGVE